MNTGKLQRLDNDQLKKIAPSIFATEPAPDVSRNRYTFVPTIEIVDALRENGLFPVYASESKSRTVNRIGYGKHMIRFRQNDKLLKVGDVIPEVIAFNAHDGSGLLVFDAGFYRCWCDNQCTVADSTFASMAVKHNTDNLVEEAIKTAVELASSLPKIADSIEDMRSIKLELPQQKMFAESALELRYHEVEDSPITVDQLLMPRREQDQGDDVWHTFNRVQENMMKGGIQGKSATGRKVKTKAISSVVEDLRLNRGLWELADSYRAVA